MYHSLFTAVNSVYQASSTQSDPLGETDPSFRVRTEHFATVDPSRDGVNDGEDANTKLDRINEENFSISDSRLGLVINNGSKMLKPSTEHHQDQLLSARNWNQLDPSFFASR